MRKTLIHIVSIFLFFILVPIQLMEGAERRPASRAPVSLQVSPQDVRLWGAAASQHFMVVAKYADGLERDVTSATRFSLSQPAKGEIDTTGKFVARSSGEVVLVLTAKYGGRSAKSVIQMEETEKPRPFTLAREIDGIFTKRCSN